MAGSVHYQGDQWPRAARSVVAWSIVIVLGPGLVRPRPLEQIFWTVVFLGAIFLIAEWAFARRLGFSVRAGSLVMHTALGWRRVPWEQIDHFAWRRWRGRLEALYVVTVDGKRILVPTIQRTAGTGWYARLFCSELVRRRDGMRADAKQTLEGALARARAARAEPVLLA